MSSAQRGGSDPDKEVHVTFLKYSYTVRGYNPIINDVESENGLIRDPVDIKPMFKDSLLRTAWDFFVRHNSFVLGSDCREEGSDLFGSSVLLLF